MKSPRTFVRWLAVLGMLSAVFSSVATAAATRALVNLSTRTTITGDTDPAVLAFQVEGSVPKTVLIRAVGPSLSLFGVPNALSDPMLTVHDASGAVIASNDDWGGSADLANAMSLAGAFPLSPTSKDSALLLTLAPGVYSARATGVNGASGTALIEIYDTTTDPRLAYLGGQARIVNGTPAIAGFVVNASTPQTLLLRVLGPALANPTAIFDPLLNVYNGSTLVASNDNWGTAATQPALVAAADTAGLLPLADGSKDSAVLLPVSAGPSTMMMLSTTSGASGLVNYEIAQIDGDRAASFAPGLVTPPGPLTAPAGSPFAITAVAIGRPYPTFQWSKDGSPIAGATDASLNIASAQSSDAGQYTVTMTNTAGSVTSAPWTLALGAPLFQTITLNTGESFDFVTQTKVADVFTGDLYFVGGSAQFSADHFTQRGILSLGSVTTALGDILPPFAFYPRQGIGAVVGNSYVCWLHSGSTGEFAAFKVVGLTPTSVTFQYQVTNSVNQPLSIRMQPFVSGTPLLPGSAVQLDVGAIGVAPLTYQWRKDGNALSGATNSSLLLQSISSLDAGNYDVVVTSPTGSTNSQAVTLTVQTAPTPPTIVGQPQPTTVNVGGTAGFTVAVAGTVPWSFQWRKNGQPIPGATAPFYLVFNATVADAGYYDVVVSNIAGSVTSQPALLTVRKLAATVSLSNLDQGYDGSPKPVTVTTVPAGLTVSVTYDGSTTPPTAVGQYDVVATIVDPKYQGSATATLTIRDVTPPVISSVSATPDVLDVPNHKMVPVTIQVSATDDVDPNPSVHIVSVTSNEPTNGNGDGNTATDWQIIGDLTLQLRAERSGTGDGRVYTITVEARDAAGNARTATTTVTVPKG